MATSNIIWAEKDVERAESANIRIITENELQYFEAFISHIGTAGRYQFLAEFLEGQEIPNLQNVRVPAVRGRFGGIKPMKAIGQLGIHTRTIRSLK